MNQLAHSTPAQLRKLWIFSDELNAGGITIVMVTHEPDVARQTRRVVWFRDGEVVNAHLTPADIGQVAAN